jgi:hypothetical protein
LEVLDLVLILIPIIKTVTIKKVRTNILKDFFNAIYNGGTFDYCAQRSGLSEVGDLKNFRPYVC